MFEAQANAYLFFYRINGSLPFVSSFSFESQYTVY